MAVAKKVATKKVQAKNVAAKKVATKKASPVSYIPESVAKFAVPMAGLTLKKGNPRKHDVPKIVELIKLHGFRIPIIIDRAGVIQSGNGRYKAAKELGMKTIPAIRQDFLSKESAEAFSIIENRSHEWSSWDYEALEKILSSKAMAGSLIQTGFTKNEVSKIKLHATEVLAAGLNLGWLIAEALKSTLTVLHYGVVKAGMLCITNLETYARIKIDAPDDTVFDLDRYRATGELSKAIVPDAVSILADYPPPPEIKDAKPVELPGDAFMAEFVSRDISQSSLQGVCVDGENKIAFATDGHIGVSRNAPAGKYAISIPANAWRTLAGAKAEHVATEEYLLSSGEGWTLSTRVQGGLAQYGKILPPQKNAELVDVREVLSAVKTLVPLVSEKTHMARFVNGSIQTSGDSLPARYDVAIDCPIRGAFNAALLAQILSAAEKVSGGNPCKYWQGASEIGARCITAGEYTFLIMPLRELDAPKEGIVYERLLPEGGKRGKTCTMRVETPLGSVNITVELGVGVSVETVRSKTAGGSFSGEIV